MAIWSQVENRRSYKIASVRPYVRPLYGMAYLNNRPKDWYEVGNQRC